MRSTGVSAIWNQACQLLIWWTQFSLCIQHSVCALIPVNSYSFWTGSCPWCWRGKGKKKKCFCDTNGKEKLLWWQKWSHWLNVTRLTISFVFFSGQQWTTATHTLQTTTDTRTTAWPFHAWYEVGGAQLRMVAIGLQLKSNWKSDHSLLILPGHCQANLIKPRPHIPEEADELSL